MQIALFMTLEKELNVTTATCCAVRN